VGKVIDNLDI